MKNPFAASLPKHKPKTIDAKRHEVVCDYCGAPGHHRLVMIRGHYSCATCGETIISCCEGPVEI